MSLPRRFAEVTFDLLGSGQPVRFLVRGRSMHPEVRDGEMVTVRPVTAGEVKVGDIILYRAGDGALAHRVIRTEVRAGRPVFILRGDASVTSDEPVEAAQVSGQVVSVTRGGRTVRLDSPMARVRHRSRAFLLRVHRWLWGA
jgi:signal peptidase I